MLDESILIRRAVNGDAAAWEPLILAHQEAVFRLSYLLLGDPDEAADIAQETFLRAWHYLPRFDATRPLRPWLLHISANLVRNHRRSAGRYLAALTRAFRAEPSIPSGPEIESTRHMEARELWAAVKELGTTDQEIVYLRFFLDLSVSETAQFLAVAEGTVKSRLSRSLKKLRLVIQRKFPALSEGHEV